MLSNHAHALRGRHYVDAVNPAECARHLRGKKAYLRLLPLLFLCYVIAYVDRTNVSIATLTMTKDMPAFNSQVIGFGSGIFFVGYFLLEIPGTLIVEKWMPASGSAGS